ncbi:MAG: hypothetical protein QOH03_573 [Kribbellaceae bacterium]|nr:hypothetical protein [Kribbellaceae bacterium]
MPWFAEGMTSDEQRSVPTPVVGALGALALAIVLLGVGGFVRFHDFSGNGSDQWVRPLGFLAAVLAVAGVGIAALTAQSRRWFGGALLLLDLVLVWQSATNDGFRFVWMYDEGELFTLQVAIGLIAFVLLAAGVQPSRWSGGAGRWMVRAAVYACATAVVTYVALQAGSDHYHSAICTNDDCDLGGLYALEWGVIALGVCLAVVLVVELVLLGARRRQRQTSVSA